jgi:membrane protease subunit (stomatin/prohibitin family)
MMAAASAEALKSAASNANGAMMGFAGMNLASNAGAGLMGAATQATQPAPAGAVASGAVPNFCPNCGAATNGANFCGNCGTKLV